jgi:molybdopterin biosynthesis enzyme
LARLEVAPEGWRASPVKSMSSADLASAAGADGVILVPPGHDSLPPGALVAFRPWRPLP